MKIIKDGETIAEMPDTRNFDGYSIDGQIMLIIDDTEAKIIARYKSNKKASEIALAMCKSYLAGKEEFILPRED